MNTFKPPIDVANNAKKAIEWREKYPKETADAGTQVGWTRARQLANRENISEDTIGRMVSFLQGTKETKQSHLNTVTSLGVIMGILCGRHGVGTLVKLGQIKFTVKFKIINLLIVCHK